MAEKKPNSYRGITRDDIEREWVRLDKQSIISHSLKLFDACEGLQVTILRKTMENEELNHLHLRLQRNYRELVEQSKTRKGRRALKKKATEKHDRKDPIQK